MKQSQRAVQFTFCLGQSNMWVSEFRVELVKTKQHSKLGLNGMNLWRYKTHWLSSITQQLHFYCLVKIFLLLIPKWEFKKQGILSSHKIVMPWLLPKVPGLVGSYRVLCVLILFFLRYCLAYCLFQNSKSSHPIDWVQRSRCICAIWILNHACNLNHVEIYGCF